jgi:hypothetical protein
MGASQSHLVEWHVSVDFCHRSTGEVLITHGCIRNIFSALFLLTASVDRCVLTAFKHSALLDRLHMGGA